MRDEDEKPLEHLTSLIALKPRQILLSELQQLQLLTDCSQTMVKKQPQHNSNCCSGKPELKGAVVHSILNYLHNNGFSKTLKRFLKEAQIESYDWKTNSVDLEDIYSRYVVHCQNSDVKILGNIDQEGTVEKDGSGSCAAEETFSKKKKKKDKKEEENNENNLKASSEPIEYSKRVDSDNDLVKDKATDTKIRSKEKKSKKPSDSVGPSKDYVNDSIGLLKEEKSINEQKDKSKKDSIGLPSQSLDSNLKDTEMLPVEVPNGLDKISEEGGKAKDKKEKKKLRTSAPAEDGQEGKINTVAKNDNTDLPLEGRTKSKGEKKKEEGLVSENNESEFMDKGKSSESGAKKESKKRKTSDVFDGENQPVEDSVHGESKRRKTDEVTGGHTGEDENVKDSQKESQRLSSEEGKVRIKGDKLMNGVKGSAEQKYVSKQRNGSAEPRTANAFQRVKVEEVKFIDERLQDNSYWAKNGAEKGYGAKAQEVLGQVKGRGFRHEKTKKKRGSYRGGQIDLQSYSIKFNYSDEE